MITDLVCTSVMKAGTYTVEELLRPVVENGRNLPLPVLPGNHPLCR